MSEWCLADVMLRLTSGTFHFQLALSSTTRILSISTKSTYSLTRAGARLNEACRHASYIGNCGHASWICNLHGQLQEASTFTLLATPILPQLKPHFIDKSERFSVVLPALRPAWPKFCRTSFTRRNSSSCPIRHPSRSR